MLRRPGRTIQVDRAPEYTFAPLIHEVAVGRIHPDSVRSPVAPHADRRCEFLCAEVTGVDLARGTVETSAGKIGYQYLALAPGSVAARPPGDLAGHFNSFGTLEDALGLRNELDRAWRAAVHPGSSARPGDLTVAIAGGGATGVELSAEIAALFDYLRKRSYRSPAVSPRVVLLEATERLMGWLDPYFHEVALRALSRLGVEVRLNTPVKEARDDGLRVGKGWLPARVRVWTAGIEASPLVRALAGDKDPMGRVRVGEHLTLPGHPEVYVLGDSGLYEDPRHGPLSPTGSLAVQQGPWAARDLGRRMRGASRRPPFDFFNRGYVVSLGPGNAVADALGAKFSGPAAQALYRAVLLYYLKGRRDRVLTGADWAMERTLGRVGFGDASGASPASTG